jgi:hypothetical protein
MHLSVGNSLISDRGARFASSDDAPVSRVPGRPITNNGTLPT